MYAEHHDYAFLTSNSLLELVGDRLLKCILSLPFRYNFFFWHEVLNYFQSHEGFVYEKLDNITGVIGNRNSKKHDIP